MLFRSEKPLGPLGVKVETTRIDADRDAFGAAGFAGVIVAPDGYANDRVRAQVAALLEPFGEPATVDGRQVYRVR